MKAALTPSKINVRWVRGNEDINLNSPLVILLFGIRGAGKSVLLETFGEHYLSNGHNVLDLFGASSGEGLAWLRSPWVIEENLAPLLIKGQNVDVASSYNTKSWRDITLHDLDNNRIVISSTPLYGERDEEFKAAGKVLDILFSRFGWSKYIYLTVREASNLFYSRVKLRQSQLESKSEAIYLVRESRHHGLSLGLDTQKLTSVDADFRGLCDYIIFKSQGIFSLPRDFWFLYGYFNPIWLRSMKSSQFAIVSRRGSLGIGINKMPDWHKRPRENLLKALDIRVEASDNISPEGK